MVPHFFSPTEGDKLKRMYNLFTLQYLAYKIDNIISIGFRGQSLIRKHCLRIRICLQKPIEIMLSIFIGQTLQYKQIIKYVTTDAKI